MSKGIEVKVCSWRVKRYLLLRRKAMANLDSVLKSRDITLPTKVCIVKAMIFPVVVYQCERWTIKKTEHWWIDGAHLNCGVGENSWESLGQQDQQVHPKGNQSWIFTGRTDAEAEASILWPPDGKSQLIGKDPDSGKDWKAGGEGDDRRWDGWMASLTQWPWVWQTPGDSEGQGGLACCSSWDHKESNTTEQLSNNNATLSRPPLPSF